MCPFQGGRARLRHRRDLFEAPRDQRRHPHRRRHRPKQILGRPRQARRLAQRLPRREGPEEKGSANPLMEEVRPNKVKRKRILRWSIGIFVVLLLIPFPTRLAPDFTVRFLGRDGRSVPGMEVRQTCTHYTYESIRNHCAGEWDTAPVTNVNGEVHFNAQYVWFGTASRAIRSVFSHILLIAHGGVGRDVTLFTSGNDSGLNSYVISIDPDNPPSEITLTDEAVDRHNQEVSSRR